MSLKGKKRYNNGYITKYFSEDDNIPEGFVKGALPKDIKRLQNLSGNRAGTKTSEETKLKLSKIKTGTIFIFNSTTNEYKVIKQEELSTFLSLGWIKKHPPQTEESIKKISESKKGIASTRKGIKYTEEEKNKRNLTLISNYGSLDQYNQYQVTLTKETKAKKYGDPNFNNLEKRKETIANINNYYKNRTEKTIKTKIEKYGSIKEAEYQKRLKIAKKYGFDSLSDYNRYWRTSILRNVNTKKSKLEKRMEAFLLSNKINYQQSYRITKDKYTHEFDFAIFDTDLVLLIDCDGTYYHGYDSDFNGKTVNSYSDDYRSLLVPKGVKFIQVIEGNDTEKLAQKEILSLIDIDYDEYLTNIFNWCRETEFPFPNYSEKVLRNSWTSLKNSDTSRFTMNCRYGEKLLLHFHPSVWYANKKGKLSPYEAWQDDILLRLAISNRIIYKGTNLDRSRVLNGFSVSGIAPRVSMFNPYQAKYIVEKYLNKYDTIFDPCSGFSGRLLGTASLDKHYIGIDINSTSVEESNRLIQYLDLNDSVSIADSSKIKGKYDCLFTCPPYKDKEIWKNSTFDLRSCDEWIDIFISNYNCDKYVFVVDNTEKYKDYVVETFKNKSHWNTNEELLVVI